MLSLQESITQSFYAWETRGRGWMRAPYPVSLEPPYRPFFLLPGAGHSSPEQIDDGKRHTLASRLVAQVRGLFASDRVEEEPPPFEEPEPYPLGDVPPLTVLRALVPEDFAQKPDAMGQVLTAVSSALHPVSFELLGSGSSITLSLVTASFDAAAVAAQLSSFLPSVAVEESDDRLASVWERSAHRRVVHFGLEDEFFLPLRLLGDFNVDPYVSLLPALGEAGAGEFLLFQVLFTPVRNPWTRAIHDALDDGDGGCLIEDAPWLLPAAREKTKTPLYGAVLRIAVQARTPERTASLLRGTHAFLSQFERAEGNALVPLHGGEEDERAVLTRTSFQTGAILSLDEILSFVHVPGAEVQHRAFGRGDDANVPLPGGARGHALVLGIHTYRGVETPVSLDHDSRFAHTWVIGGSGTGKSTLLARMILEDVRVGHGLAVLDPHGDLIDDVLARIPKERTDDVVLFDPADTEYPVPLSVLYAADPLEEHLIASDLVGVLRRFATSWGDSMSTVLGEAVLAMLRTPLQTSLRDLRRFLVDEDIRKEFLATVSDPDIRHFWEKEYPLIGTRSIGPLLTRLDAFLRMRLMRNILGTREARLNLVECMREGKVVLARLAKGQIGEENAYLLGSLLLGKLSQLTLMRQALLKDARRPFFIYADEFQHFVTPSMESLATEGRKYRVGLVVAHQTLSQLSEVKRIESALLGNCHTRIVFRTGDADADSLAKGFAHIDAETIRGLKRGEAAVRMGDATADFLMRTEPLPGVDQDDEPRVARLIRENTRERYAVRPEAIVAVTAPPTTAAVSAPASATPVSPTEAAPPVQRPQPPAARPPRVSLPATPGRGGGMHKYLQHLVKRLGEERGFRATIEGEAGAGQADVLLLREDVRIACEIGVTTDGTHEVANLKKCIEAGYAHVIAISPERKTRAALRVAAEGLAGNAAVQVIAPEEIVTALDRYATPEPTETVVRGYKVKVSRQSVSPEGDASRRAAIAAVIAKGLGR